MRLKIICRDNIYVTPNSGCTYGKICGERKFVREPKGPSMKFHYHYLTDLCMYYECYKIFLKLVKFFTNNVLLLLIICIYTIILQFSKFLYVANIQEHEPYLFWLCRFNYPRNPPVLTLGIYKWFNYSAIHQPPLSVSRSEGTKLHELLTAQLSHRRFYELFSSYLYVSNMYYYSTNV